MDFFSNIDFGQQQQQQQQQQHLQQPQQQHLQQQQQQPKDLTNFIESEAFFNANYFFNAYTPSYGSPQSSSIGSSPSLSDYEPSDGYSSSSGFSSPHLAGEIFDDEHNAMLYSGAGCDMQEQQQFAADLNALTYPLPADLLQATVTGGDIKVEPSHPFGSLKLNTNVTPAMDEPAGQQFMQTDDSFAATAAAPTDDTFDGAAPTFHLLPATPMTPTKAKAIADSLYPLVSADQVPPPISEESVSSIADQSQEAQRQTKSDNIMRSRTPPISHSHTRSHHRKPLPSDMAERLHTMNLAPPKPSRKSKTTAPFQCPYPDCPKTFTRQYNLKSHLRTHTDERPFVCGFQGCTRAFARQHDRKRHYNLHLGFKPHVCSHCGRAFARLDALNRHLRSDSGAPCAQATLPNGGSKKFKPVNM